MALEYDNYADKQALKIDTENRIAEYHTQYNVSTEYLDLLTQRAMLANIREENKWNVIRYHSKEGDKDPRGTLCFDRQMFVHFRQNLQ